MMFGHLSWAQHETQHQQCSEIKEDSRNEKSRRIPLSMN